MIKVDKFNKISDDGPAFIIAEIGSNHNQKLSLAYKMIDTAKKCGANAVKFQTFKAKYHFSKYSPSFKFLNNAPMYDLIKSLEINRLWHKKLYDYCEKKKITFFSSPCDLEAVDDLHKVGTKIYKVSSFDLTDLNLVSYIARKKKPIILSTGLASLDDISRAIKICKKEKNNKIILLECTSLYPAPEKLMNLNAIIKLKNKYKIITGLSDHSLGDHMILASIGMGAKVIEKHFTLSKQMKGPDHKFAMEPKEFEQMINKIRKIESGMGDGYKVRYSKEELLMSKKARRSIHAIKDIPKGKKIEESDLIFKRPGLGIEPHLVSKIIGQTSKKKIKEDSWIKWSMLKK